MCRLGTVSIVLTAVEGPNEKPEVIPFWTMGIVTVRAGVRCRTVRLWSLCFYLCTTPRKLGYEVKLHTFSTPALYFVHSVVETADVTLLCVFWMGSYQAATVFLNTSAVPWHSTCNKRKAVHFSERWVDSNCSTWSHIPGDRDLHRHRCDNPRYLVNPMFAGRQLQWPFTV